MPSGNSSGSSPSGDGMGRWHLEQEYFLAEWYGRDGQIDDCSYSGESFFEPESTGSKLLLLKRERRSWTRQVSLQHNSGSDDESVASGPQICLRSNKQASWYRPANY